MFYCKLELPSISSSHKKKINSGIFLTNNFLSRSKTVLWGAADSCSVSCPGKEEALSLGDEMAIICLAIFASAIYGEVMLQYIYKYILNKYKILEKKKKEKNKKDGGNKNKKEKGEGNDIKSEMKCVCFCRYSSYCRQESWLVLLSLEG